MARDFSAVAAVLVDLLGDKAARLSLPKLMEAANRCIDQDRVPYMDPVKASEAVDVSSAVMRALRTYKARMAEADKAMPALTGREIIVRWAAAIRKRAIESAELARRNAILQRDEATAMRIDRYVEGVIRKEVRAEWFIENRRALDMLPALFGQNIASLQPDDGEKQIASEAVAQLALKPIIVRKPGFAELRADGKKVFAVYENDSDFQRIVRSRGLKWDPKLTGWRGMMFDGPASEQIAALARALIKEGFVVLVLNEMARALASDCCTDKEAMG